MSPSDHGETAPDALIPLRALDPLETPLTGIHLIEASAGTGKTYTITTLVLRLVLEQGLEIDQVLVVTFTRAATAELRERVRDRLRAARAAFDSALAGGPRRPGPDPLLDALVARSTDLALGQRRLDRALQGFDRATISTIHGFCQRMLQENAFESGAPFGAELVGDDRALQREILVDWWARSVHDASPLLVRHLAARKVNVGSLTDLVKRVVGAPDAPVLPPLGTLSGASPEALAEVSQDFEDAWSHASDLWSKEHGAVAALINGQTGLNGNKYRNVDAKLAALDAWLTGAPDASAPKVAVLFSAIGLAAGMKKGHTAPYHEVFDALDVLVDACNGVARTLDAEILWMKRGLVDEVRAEMVRRKQVQGVWSFDDLLLQLRDALADGAESPLARRIRERFKAALIDEFQDTDPVQYAVFSTVWAGQVDSALFLIGDPKQAIYAFRGADIFAYLAARRDATAAWTMDTNWRSDPGVLSAMDALFRRGPDPFVLDGIDFVQVGPRTGAEDRIVDADGAPVASFEIGLLEREGRTGKRAWARRITKQHARLAERTADRIVTLLRSGWEISGEGLRPGHIAVLARTGRQAAEVQAALRQLGVPSVLQTDASVFDTETAQWLRALLQATVDPRSATRVRSALATPLWGRSAAAILALADDGSGPSAGWGAEVERLRGWLDVWENRGFMAAFRRMLSDLRVPERVLAWPNGERVLTDLLHLSELAQAEASSARLSPPALARWFDQVLLDARQREDDVEVAQLRLESDAEAVQLVTMHRAKGLEYPIVLCPFLASSGGLHTKDKEVLRFHAADNGDALTLDMRPAGDGDRLLALAQAERESMAESLRVLYVALTRARHRCEVVWGALDGHPTSPLGYLLHPPVGAEPGEDRRAATAKRIASMDDAAILAELNALATDSGGALTVRCIDDQTVAPWRAGAESPPALTARSPRPLGRGWSTSSFSRLAQASDTEERFAADDARDHDERAAPIEEPTVMVGPGVALDGFAKGARAGNLLHDILEHVDFVSEPGRGGMESGEMERVAGRMLGRYGEDPDVWTAPLSRALRGVLDTPLGRDPSSPRLSDIPQCDRISEMEFILPVAHGEAAQTLTPDRLADALARWAGPGMPADYPSAVRRLRFRELQGWMRGFVDLVFVHNERWYVVDYKSNHLGPRPDDYVGASLERAMVHHHYVLQYHLYCVALHRFLRRRLAGYDPSRHFGGVAYMFLRGMAPHHAPGCGVFEDHPSPALLDGLSDVLEGLAAETDGAHR
jgi:exodeoxyribonuclease V beta subunit